MAKTGIVNWSAEQIECKAEEVLRFYNPSALEIPQVTGILAILHETKKRFGVEYAIRDLGFAHLGGKVLGAFQFDPRAIFIDRCVIGTSREPFTMAHEFGHLVLHRNTRVTAEDYQFSDTRHELATGKKLLTTPREWIEWQANRFAAALLMPRRTLQSALVAAQKERGVCRNLGMVYLDNQRQNNRDFIGIQGSLSERYQVSRMAIRHRLADLGFLFDRRDRGIAHVSKLFLAGSTT